MKYIIYAPPYNRKSGGSVALWKLGKFLKDKGEDAVIYIWRDGSNENKPAPSMWDLEVFDRVPAPEGLVIYPELIFGNPLKAKKVVRYALNFRGFLGGPADFPKEDLVFVHSPGFRRYEEDVLFIPPIELDIFKDIKAERKGTCCYFGKGKRWNKELIASMSKEVDSSILINKEFPEEREELAKIFQTSELLYCFDEITAISLEATLCGCPTIVLSSVFVKPRDMWVVQEGAGVGMEELQYAKDTVHLARDKYIEYIEQFPKQLENFITKTKNFYKEV